MNAPEMIIIHHSATADGSTLNDFNAIRNYHINTNKWNDIGYHWVIEYDNGIKVKQGRKENVTGAHTLGYNEKSIGICVVGNFDKTQPTVEQMTVLKNLITDIYKRYGRLPIHYHNEFANKTCPGKFFYDKFRLQSEVDKMIETKTAPVEQWKIDERNKLIARGIDISEERYDEPITRAEAFALMNKVLTFLGK